MLLFRTNGMKQSTLLLLLFLCLVLPVDGQNLVPNGSFEEYIDCPLGLDDMQALGWSSSRGSCDYYNACNNDILDCGVGVPCNVFGYQMAYDGQGYVGFVQFRVPDPETLREQLMCSLIEPLVIGETYYFSMRINRGNSVFNINASNGQGFLLTNEQYNAIDNPSPAFEEYTYVNQEILTDSTNWISISTSFVAEQAFSRLVLGAFLETAMLDTISIGTPLPYGAAYYFIDDVRLSTDSNFVFTDVLEQIEKTPLDINIYPNPNQGFFKLSKRLNTGSIIIKRITGEIIKRFEIENELTEYDCSELSSGNYIVTVMTDKTIDHLKLIKQ
jgi:hypothetical protein